MAQKGHDDSRDDHYTDLIGPEGAERLIIAESEEWLQKDDSILIASENYVSLNEWR